jgi:hypothetical protein
VLRNDILEKAKTDVFYKKQINCGRLSIPCVYGKYLNSEEGCWQSQDLEPGRAVKDCSIDNNYLIDKLGYHFTLLIDKIRLSEVEKKQLTDAEIDIIEIDIFKSDKLSKLYDLVDGGAYLFTPDQYILGRWRNFRLSTVLDLINSYMKMIKPISLKDLNA